MLRAKSGQQSRNTGPRSNPAEIQKPQNLADRAEYGRLDLDRQTAACSCLPWRPRCSGRAAQQSNAYQHTSLRNLWSSSTSSRISSGSCARCHWHSRRPDCSCSSSGAAARAALIA